MSYELSDVVVRKIQTWETEIKPYNNGIGWGYEIVLPAESTSEVLFDSGPKYVSKRDAENNGIDYRDSLLEKELPEYRPF